MALPGGVLDGPGGKSSKRLSALLALGAAISLSFVAGFFKMKDLPVVELVIAFLTYSAAMQGVSYLSERKK